MSINQDLIQQGMSMPEFTQHYGTDAQCEAALARKRWPEGFRCPRCTSANHSVVNRGARRLFQCRACRHQTSLTASTVMDSSKLPLRTWFLAVYLINQSDAEVTPMSLMRRLGTTYRTAWLLHKKLKSAGT